MPGARSAATAKRIMNRLAIRMSFALSPEIYCTRFGFALHAKESAGCGLDWGLGAGFQWPGVARPPVPRAD